MRSAIPSSPCSRVHALPSALQACDHPAASLTRTCSSCSAPSCKAAREGRAPAASAASKQPPAALKELWNLCKYLAAPDSKGQHCQLDSKIWRNSDSALLVAPPACGPCAPGACTCGQGPPATRRIEPARRAGRAAAAVGAGDSLPAVCCPAAPQPTAFAVTAPLLTAGHPAAASRAAGRGLSGR